MAFNILIVDDSSSMRGVIKKTLEMSGLEVGEIFEAGNGLEALGVLDEQWADVILTDVHMPEMDGFGLLKALNRQGVVSHTPVVVVTTEGREERIEELKALGAMAWINKPFRPEQIKATVLEVLGLDETALDQKADIDGCDF
ncbi:MAG: response regulator [Deltaproteobacteria bacterium]|nr:response regulator [Deltaproteobacteria bacterium]